MLVIEQLQTSWSDNEFGLDVLYQSNQCGCQQNVEYHLEREINH